MDLWFTLFWGRPIGLGIFFWGLGVLFMGIDRFAKNSHASTSFRYEFNNWKYF